MNLTRRYFLRSLGMATLGITFLPKVFAEKAFAGLRGNKASAVILSGKVHADGKGIPGVAVTDGVNLSVTDDKGNYVLESNDDSTFVYISTPRGFEIAHEKGIARFYKNIEVQKGKFNADFNLRKLAVDDTKHAFVVWADTQIQSEEDATLLKTQAAMDTRDLIKSYGKDLPFHGIGCGDLVWDKFELFDDYKEAVHKTEIPFFQVIGNHDMDLDSRTDDNSTKTFKSHFGPTYYSFNRGEVHYVFLDDVFFTGTAQKYIGYIPENQFAWLEQDLEQVKPGTTVVVSLHIPVNTGVRRRNKLNEDPISGVVSNRRELYRILKPYNAHIMSGHTHFNEKIFEENVIEHVHGTVCGAWWTGPICYDGTPNGYGVYEVEGSKIKWFHKAVGYEKDHQFRIYPVGAVKEKPDHFSVNVWNWDPEWKVEWFEDGKNMGEMVRETSHDPLSVELHAGAEKPAKHAWVDPVLTDHMFFAKSTAESLAIQVTDRFKNVYRKDFRLSELKTGVASN